ARVGTPSPARPPHSVAVRVSESGAKERRPALSAKKSRAARQAQRATRWKQEIRGAESTLTGREIAKPIPLAIVPSAESIACAGGRRHRGICFLQYRKISDGGRSRRDGNKSAECRVRATIIAHLYAGAIASSFWTSIEPAKVAARWLLWRFSISQRHTPV